MALPGFQNFIYPVLKYSSEYDEVSLNDIQNYLTDYFSITEEEKAERVPSGLQTKFYNRVAWTKSYLFKAKLIENTRRSHFKITDRGRQFLQQFSTTKYISINDLRSIEEFKKFQSITNSSDEENNVEKDANISDEIKTPLEILEENYQIIKNELASELLEKIRTKSWQFFEDLVVDLMVKMGYGGSRYKVGESIKRTRDEGIDGIINQDKLGLDVIYLQAKMWKDESSIGRPEIQKFVGALQGKRAKKGVFITTSSFTKDAIEYANTIESKVILIDGDTLTNLMIEHNVGVTPIETYQIKKIDLDYFEQ